MSTPGQRADSRAAALLPEEAAAGTSDPHAQAASVLLDSDQRQADRDARPDAGVERRRSEDTVDPQ